MGEQLSLLEDFYKDDKRKAKVLDSMERLARGIKHLWGLLYFYEAGRDMFSPKGKQANICMDEMEYLAQALGMVVYDELDDHPKLQGKTLEEVTEQFCKLELVGGMMEVPTEGQILSAAYDLPQRVTSVSVDIHSQRKEYLMKTLLETIVEIEDL